MNEHLKAFMTATTQAENACKELIKAELKENLAQAEAVRDKAVIRLREAYEALQNAKQPIADLDKEIAEAENSAQEWAEARTSDELGARVAARTWQSQWSEELIRLIRPAVPRCQRTLRHVLHHRPQPRRNGHITELCGGTPLLAR